MQLLKHMGSFTAVQASVCLFPKGLGRATLDRHLLIHLHVRGRKPAHLQERSNQ